MHTFDKIQTGPFINLLSNKLTFVIAYEIDKLLISGYNTYEDAHTLVMGNFLTGYTNSGFKEDRLLVILNENRQEIRDYKAQYLIDSQ